MREKRLTVKVPTIYLDGGLIQGVEGFPASARYDVIDYDTEGVEEADLCSCEAGDGEHCHSQRETDSEGSGG